MTSDMKQTDLGDVKLYYFNVRGRTECIRMLFHAAGVPFEDHRIEYADWPEEKKAAPFGKVPYVVYKGKKYGQSMAIASFFAKKFGFYGQTDEDALKQEQLMQLVQDLRTPHVRNWILERDPEKKAEFERQFREELFPHFLPFFEALLEDNGSNGHFVGNSVTLADMYLQDMLETVLDIHPQALDAFPLQRKLRSNVANMPGLKEYLANRPKTVM